MVASERRERILRFVCTEAEEKKIRRRAKAAGMTLSDYLRSVAIPRED